MSVRSIAVIVIVTLSLILWGCQDSPSRAAIKRAQQWIELQEWQNARTELRTAIRAEPQSIEARLLLVDTVITEAQENNRNVGNLLEDAFEMLKEIERIDPNNSNIAVFRTEAYSILNALMKSGGLPSIRIAIAIVNKYPSIEVSSGLITVMAYTEDSLAKQALLLLEKIDPDLARQKLIELFQISPPPVRERIALELWNRERYEPARLDARRKLIENLRNTKKLAGARSISAQISDTGYRDVSEIFREMVVDAFNDATSDIIGIAAFEQITKHEKQKGAELATALIGTIDPENSRKACSKFGTVLVRSLGSNSATASHEILRKIVGPYILHKVGCISNILDSLQRIDGKPWRSIRYSYPGWSIFRTMIPGRIAVIRSRNSADKAAYAGRKWELFSAAASHTKRELTDQLLSLGTWGLSSWGHKESNRRLLFNTKQLDFLNPKSCVMKMDVVEEGHSNRRTTVGELSVLLSAGGGFQKQPWQIAKVESFIVDGRDLQKSSSGASKVNDSARKSTSSKSNTKRTRGTYSSSIQIKVPTIAENGEVVPVSVDASGLDAKKISVYSLSRSNLAIEASFLADYVNRTLSTRIKMQRSGPIIVEVTSKGGKIFYSKSYVEVKKGASPTSGVKSGISEKNIKVRHKKSTIKMLIKQPMTTNNHITKMTVSTDGKKAVDVKLTPWITKNPYFSFKQSRPFSNYRIDVKTSNGGRATKSN